MPYVDYLYYTETYKGVSVDETDFPTLEIRASEIIDELTMHKVKQGSLDTYSPFIQEQFKKAMCAQIEYIDSIGGVDVLDEQPMQSMALGKFNYSGQNTNTGNSNVSPRVKSLLFPTGLLYRGL
mgnify:CR=1 FL=1